MCSRMWKPKPLMCSHLRFSSATCLASRKSKPPLAKSSGLIVGMPLALTAFERSAPPAKSSMKIVSSGFKLCHVSERSSREHPTVGQSENGEVPSFSVCTFCSEQVGAVC